MENNFNLLLKEKYNRLHLWKEFREDLIKNNISEEEQIKNVLSFWKGCSLVKYALDWTNPDSWPTAWELIYEGDVCKNALCYLMEQTFILAGGNWICDRFKIYVIYDHDLNEEYMILVIDDNIVLNYEYNKISYLNEIDNYTIKEIYKPVSSKKHISINQMILSIYRKDLL